MRRNFYQTTEYRQLQSEIAKHNWQKGIYASCRKREKRICACSDCDKVFEVKPSDKKKFCSHSCSAKVSNKKRSKISYNCKNEIERMYNSGYSMAEIAQKLGCSNGAVVYAMRKHDISRRSLSEATYLRHNPNGDPFAIKRLDDEKDLKLFYTAVGLYLGEGDKRNKHSLKLANTDPKILKIFLLFLREICNVREKKIRAELNIFDDVDLKQAKNFWVKNVGISQAQIRSCVVRLSKKQGTYRNKSEYGTLAIAVDNMKLKNIINNWCDELLNFHHKLI